MKKILSHLLLAATLSLGAICPNPAGAQTQQEAMAAAQALFLKGDYVGARQKIAPFTTANDRDPKINFLFGAAEAMTGHDLDDALKRLHIAQLRNFRKNEANLFIGRAYQLKCEYDLARSAFAKFVQTNKVDSLTALANTFDAQCQSSVLLASKIFSLQVAAKNRVAKKQVTAAYAAGKECGSVCPNSHFFQSDIDPDGLMYITERADAVLFSLPDDDGFSRLMRMEKLIGGWGEMSKLRGLEGEWDDIAPVLMTDGVTVYFASNRPGGMGGFDIYRTTYDPETRTYSDPVNMGVPFNSPFDDFLFMPDEFSGRAWFATNRETFGTDSVTVCEILWDGSPIRSTAKSTTDIQTALSLEVDPDVTPTSTAANAQQSQQPAFARDDSFVAKEAFRFVICDSLTYTQWEHFRSQQAARTYRQVVAATAAKDSLVALMAEQRKVFASLSSSIERNNKLQELLRTERSIYTLEDEVSDKTEAARNEEISEINRLVAQGQYTPLSKIKVSNPGVSKLEGTAWLRPGAFTVYSPVFFRDARKGEDEEVMELFTAAQRSLIEEQDSMLAWARIVELEADRLDAAALGRQTSDDDAIAFAAKAEAYRLAAARLTSDAYDRLLEIYEAKYRVVIVTLTGYDASDLVELRGKAHSLFASIDPADIASGEADKRDAALAAKRRGLASMVKCMQRYAVHADGSFPLPEGDGSSVTVCPEPTDTLEPSPLDDETAPVAEPATTEPTLAAPSPAAPESEPVPAQQPEASATVEPTPTATPTAQAVAPPTHRIQLGAFKKKPAALDALPNQSAIQSVFLPERGITRYYYGAYTSPAEATDDLKKAHEVGFSGAFVTKID